MNKRTATRLLKTLPGDFDGDEPIDIHRYLHNGDKLQLYYDPDDTCYKKGYPWEINISHRHIVAFKTFEEARNVYLNEELAWLLGME